MEATRIPLVDDSNPFYCPAISASAYLASLSLNHRHLTGRGLRSPCRTARALSASSDDEITSDWILGEYFTSDHGWLESTAVHPDAPPPYSPMDHVRRSNKGSSKDPTGKHNPAFDMHVTRRRPTLKRKASETFSDLRAPPKYARSVPSLQDSSFDAEISRVSLRFLGPDSSPMPKPQAVKDADEPPTASKNFHDLVEQLASEMPGIRLQERLRALNPPTAQSIMDFLAENDHINERTLKILCHSNVQTINFTPTMFDRNGLNLRGQEMYLVLKTPNAFRDLIELSFAGIRLQDFDIVHLHNLACLSTLFLNQTGIGNEGVFLLVPLKNTLTRLSLAANPDIDNDAVPALLLLSRLNILSILDTGIEMNGVRWIAKTHRENNRDIEVEIPRSCEDYVDAIDSHYLCNPRPPLITNDQICSQLSTTALRRNLEAHAAWNSTILASGSRPEMTHRLSEILKVRELDMLVLEMLEGSALVEQKFGASF